MKNEQHSKSHKVRSQDRPVSMTSFPKAEMLNVQRIAAVEYGGRTYLALVTPTKQYLFLISKMQPNTMEHLMTTKLFRQTTSIPKGTTRSTTGAKRSSTKTR